MPTYSYITLAVAQQELSNRLYDGSQVFWPAAELTLYIQEALRTWNALTSFWRGDFTFTAIPGQPFYDLSSAAAPMGNTLRPNTLTDTSIYPILQAHLLEPMNWNPWTGESSQFSADDLMEALQRRRDEILAVTGCQVTHSQVPTQAGRITLPDTTIDIRRIAYLTFMEVAPSSLLIQGAGGTNWILTITDAGVLVLNPTGATGVPLFLSVSGTSWEITATAVGELVTTEVTFNPSYPTAILLGGPTTQWNMSVSVIGLIQTSPGGLLIGRALWPEDQWAMQAFQRGWTQQPAGTPTMWMQSTEPPISFDVDRIPAVPGIYDLLTINSGPTFAVVAPKPLGIPDDWSWVAKWGALADLLSRDSLARDPLRATYAERRYRMGLAVLATAPALLLARVNNVPLQIDAVRSADLFDPTWQDSQGAPAALLVAGMNIIATAPLADDAGPYSMTLTVVENAPVPSNAGDFIQLSRGDLDVILDYAEHLALYKCGGAEFQSSLPLLSRFLKAASGQNSKLMEIAEFAQLLYAISQDEQRMNPTYAEAPSQGQPATQTVDAQ